MKTALPTVDELTQPLRPLTVKWTKWGIARIFMNTIGQLSRGIRIGSEHGFDSGTMLDYIYENRPQGEAGIGRAIDAFYLNSPGWKGIRQRKVHLKKVLKEIVADFKNKGIPTQIMDVASGPGQYLIEVVRETAGANVRVLCRDLNEAGLEQGRRKVEAMGVTGIVYEKADAFSCGDLRRANPTPNVIVVSGLYELFTDDDIIRRSMRDVSSVLKRGDYFVCTNQPYHPQLEMIARVLPNRLGEPWVMRLRADETIQQWAKEAGFEHMASLIDKDGIFSVHKFRKV